MKFFTFFGKLRRKLLKLLFGRQLIRNIENISDIPALANQIAQQNASLFKQSEEQRVSLSNQIAEQGAQISRLLKEKEFNFELILETIEAQHTHHKTFGQYKNCFHNMDVVLTATGPSLADFESIPDAVYVGVNAAVLSEKLCLDYLFVQDYLAVKSYIGELLHYKNENLKRFYGILNPKRTDGVIIPESVIIEHNASKFYVEDVWYRQDLLYGWNFALDPSFQILRTYGNISSTAIQFILYGNPKRIYLVGCDTANIASHAVGPNLDTSCGQEGLAVSTNAIKFGWTELKKFASVYYPDTEIISVNPVGLTGLFKDVYTESYLEKHPEIQGEIL